jgi:hypothetical protein
MGDGFSAKCWKGYCAARIGRLLPHPHQDRHFFGAWPQARRKRHQRCTNQTDHYMISMTNTRSDNLIPIAEWKAKHQPNQPQVQRVPVYVPVRDPSGRWRLELTGTTTFDPEFYFYVDPS